MLVEASGGDHHIESWPGMSAFARHPGRLGHCVMAVYKERMVITKDGTPYHEPPYTKAEEDQFYRRVGNGIVAFTRPSGMKPPQPPQQLIS